MYHSETKGCLQGLSWVRVAGRLMFAVKNTGGDSQFRAVILAVGQDDCI